MLITFELADPSPINQPRTILVNSDYIVMVTIEQRPGEPARTVAHLSLDSIGTVTVLLGDNLAPAQLRTRLNSLVTVNRGTHLDELQAPLWD
ncbi:hypothetical protein HQQ81_21265 [Microbacteriaceae bacterium VKM Ac-2854]|nr:hypothetical protein [Microbacteriaceae bacterium VKM Ac-2854]